MAGPRVVLLIVLVIGGFGALLIARLLFGALLSMRESADAITKELQDKEEELQDKEQGATASADPS